ncbi:MAG: 16S rRNA (guanine(527)-N(7))-methyltransferase RsmG [Desulfobacterales bacterium]|nr:16S rRNA (guanine(527)-N(7))-methyltransferase RsmG [Deltaproteobacteria bacterium]NNK94040.1 16S rRNA (guanine(527)-N(7))-methyltransferase RsmG [Desulfobacterales bacterium]
MHQKQFSDLIVRGIEGFEFEPDEARIDALYIYFRELKRWSAKINLISKETSEEAIVEKHFIDSMALLDLLDEQGDHLADIGSGAGFPGLVCKIAMPQVRVSLIEPRLKRVSFLRHIIRTSGLSSIDVQANRIEADVELTHEAEFTAVAGRAVKDINQFLEMCERFNKPSCRVFCMKGPRYKTELSNAAQQLIKWNLIETKHYHLPFSQAARALLVFQGR